MMKLPAELEAIQAGCIDLRGRGLQVGGPPFFPGGIALSGALGSGDMRLNDVPGFQ